MKREMPSSLRWILLALLGLLIAVAVGIAASELTSQQIGLSSEPLRAGQELAPQPSGSGDDHGQGGEHVTTTTAPETTTTSPPETTTAPPPTTTVPPETSTDDYSGDGDGDDD